MSLASASEKLWLQMRQLKETVVENGFCIVFAIKILHLACSDTIYPACKIQAPET